jgi:hypothetical protein
MAALVGQVARMQGVARIKKHVKPHDLCRSTFPRRMRNFEEPQRTWTKVYL